MPPFAHEFEDFELREKGDSSHQPGGTKALGAPSVTESSVPAQFEQASGAKAGERAGLERLAALRAFWSVCQILIHVAFIHTVSSEANHGRCDA